jgi:hypothetical protein
VRQSGTALWARETSHSRPRTWACAVIVEALDEDGALVDRVGRALDLVRVLLQSSYQLAVVRTGPAASGGPCNTQYALYTQLHSPAAFRLRGHKPCLQVTDKRKILPLLENEPRPVSP